MDTLEPSYQIANSPYSQPEAFFEHDTRHSYRNSWYIPKHTTFSRDFDEPSDLALEADDMVPDRTQATSGVETNITHSGVTSSLDNVVSLRGKRNLCQKSSGRVSKKKSMSVRHRKPQNPYVVSKITDVGSTRSSRRTRVIDALDMQQLKFVICIMSYFQVPSAAIPKIMNIAFPEAINKDAFTYKSVTASYTAILTNKQHGLTDYETIVSSSNKTEEDIQSLTQLSVADRAELSRWIKLINACDM